MPIRARAWAVVLALAVAAHILGAVGVFAQGAQRIDKNAERAMQKLIDAAILDAQKLVDGVMAGQPAPSEVPMSLQHHSLKAQQGRVFVPFTLTFDRAKVTTPSIVYYLRVVNRAAPPPPPVAKTGDKTPPPVEYAAEQFHFVDIRASADPTQPYRFQRAFTVPAGEYDVYLVIKERPLPDPKDPKATPKAAVSVLKETVTVPAYWSNELMTSAVIVSTKFETLAAPLPPNEQLNQPYVLGAVKLTPSPDNKFTKKDELSAVFFVYNEGLDKETNKPDLLIEVLFHVKKGGAEKPFSKTPPTEYNAKTLPPQWDINAGHQILVPLGWAMTPFPEGDYRLEIKVTDKVTGKTKTENVMFSVVAG